MASALQKYLRSESGGGGGRDGLEGEGPQRRPPKRLGRRLEEVSKAVGGGYCRLQMPLKRALGVKETVAGHRLGAREAGGGAPPPLPIRPEGGGGGAVQRRGTQANLSLAFFLRYSLFCRVVMALRRALLRSTGEFRPAKGLPGLLLPPSGLPALLRPPNGLLPGLLRPPSGPPGLLRPGTGPGLAGRWLLPPSAPNRLLLPPRPPSGPAAPGLAARSPPLPLWSIESAGAQGGGGTAPAKQCQARMRVDGEAGVIRGAGTEHGPEGRVGIRPLPPFEVDGPNLLSALHPPHPNKYRPPVYRRPGQRHSSLFFLAQTQMSWRSPLTSQYSRRPLGIKVQSCPVLR